MVKLYIILPMTDNLTQNTISETAPRTPLKEEIFEVLHAKIVGGEVSPGEWLRQEDIATQLGVSMTPVREALDLLVSVGLAERVPYRGVRVPEPSGEEIAEAYAMRLLLEAASARAAAFQHQQVQIDELKHILSRMKGLVTLQDMSLLRQLSREFHQSIVAIGGNAIFNKIYEMVMNAFPDWMLYEYLFRHTDLLEASLAEEYLEHMALVKAIEAGDADLAEQQATAHIHNLGKELVIFLGIPHEVLESKAKIFQTPFTTQKNSK
jgi:DNA-binding GntR family transcriptional regulator